MKNKRLKHFFEELIKFFLQGLLYSAPIAITVYTLYKVFGLLDGLLPFSFPGVGILSILLGITIIGFLANTILAEAFMYYIGKLLERTPFINLIYTSVKDIMKALLGEKRKFNEPVLVKMNSNPVVEKLGFITQSDLSKIGLSEGKVAVYFPISYNMSGDLFIVNAENVTPVNASSTDVMKFIISGGMTGA